MKRDSKGRFIKRGRRGTRGFGSIITIRRGMGALPGGALGEAIIPGLVGGLVTAATALGIRYWVDPARGNTQRMFVRHAPWIGHAAGIVASLGLMLVGGNGAAISSFVAATGVGLSLFGSDMLFQKKGGSLLMALAPATERTATEPGPTTTEEAAAAEAGGVEGLRRYRSMRRLGTGAIVPEYSRGMGAIAMEPVGPSGRRAGTIGSYGETVTLQGINTGAFGTPGFNA